MVVARFALIKNSQGNKGRAQQLLRGFKYVKQEQSKRKLDFLSKKWNSKNKQELNV
jgi:hypothetical protein